MYEIQTSNRTSKFPARGFFPGASLDLSMEDLNIPIKWSESQEKLKLAAIWQARLKEELDKQRIEEAGRSLVLSLLANPPRAFEEVSKAVHSENADDPEVLNAVHKVQTYSPEREATLYLIRDKQELSPEDLTVLQKISRDDKSLDEAVLPELKKAQTPTLGSLQYETWIGSLISKSFQREQQSLQTYSPHRTLAAWRLVREMARSKRLIQRDQSLMEALPPDQPAYDDLYKPREDPWTIPEPARTQTMDYLRFERGLKSHERLCTDYLKTCEYAESLKEEFQDFLWFAEDSEWKISRRPGLALLPPKVPFNQYLDNGDVKASYNPADFEHDPLLHAYTRGLYYVSKHLYFELNSKKNPGMYDEALSSLLNPAYVRLVFPSRIQIISVEALLVEETMDLMVSFGITHAKKTLHEKYGFLTHELDQLSDMAKIRAAECVNTDVEQTRSLIILRLEDIAKRCREALDIRAELAAVKQLAVVTGVTQVKPESLEQSFIDMVKSTSSSRKFVDNVAE